MGSEVESSAAPHKALKGINSIPINGVIVKTSRAKIRSPRSSLEFFILTGLGIRQAVRLRADWRKVEAQSWAGRLEGDR